MSSLDDIRVKLEMGAYELTRHALRRVVERNISSDEICQAGAGAVLVEEYPADKYGPSGLLLGFTRLGHPLHIQVSFADSELVKIVTLYEPEVSDWMPGFLVRRS